MSELFSRTFISRTVSEFTPGTLWFQEYVRALLQDVYQQVSFRIHTRNLEVPGVCQSFSPGRISG